MKGWFIAVIIVLSVYMAAFFMQVIAHAPSSMELEYDFESQELTVTITHPVASTTNHYVDQIIVYRNNIPVIEEEYTSQPDTPTFTLFFDVTAVDGDVLRVYAHCELSGEIEEEISVVGTRDYMTLSVNPEPEEVEMEEDVYMTVNIYRTDDETPLDGVEVVPDPDLGFIGDVEELGLGAYGFTYEAPNLEEEDIEIINLTCTKNGYHPLYHEIAFDLVYAADDSRNIVVEIDPIVYTMDEGERKVFTVEVFAGGSNLDIPDIDVDYSHGKLSKEAEGTGEFKLTYTADQVDTDTTAFLRVTASKSGYVTGTDEIQFKIMDRGEQAAADEQDGGNNIIWYVAGGFIAIGLIVIVVIFIRRGKSEDEYEEVQVAEVIDEGQSRR